MGAPVRLGKLTAKKDERNLMFAKYLAPRKQLPAAARKVTRSSIVPSWPMYGNDSLGDCTCAAVGHIEQLVSAAAKRPETPTDQSVLNLYWATGSQDDGRYCLDVLNYWQSTGFGPVVEKILAFTEVKPKRHDQVKLAIQWLGNLYIGLALPVSAQTQKAWKVTRGANAKPGSWGGHCVSIHDYDHNGLVCVTWGKLVRMSWGFFDRYCDEAYTVLSPDWFDSTGHSPLDAGSFDAQRLLDDVKALS